MSRKPVVKNEVSDTSTKGDAPPGQALTSPRNLQPASESPFPSPAPHERHQQMPSTVNSRASFQIIFHVPLKARCQSMAYIKLPLYHALWFTEASRLSGSLLFLQALSEDRKPLFERGSEALDTKEGVTSSVQEVEESPDICPLVKSTNLQLSCRHIRSMPSTI